MLNHEPLIGLLRSKDNGLLIAKLPRGPISLYQAGFLVSYAHFLVRLNVLVIETADYSLNQAMISKTNSLQRIFSVFSVKYEV